MDDLGVLRCIPDTEIAYALGGNRLTPAGEKLRAGSDKNLNYHTLNIEMCENEDADIASVTRCAAALAAALLRRHGLPISALYRHSDLVQDKTCPQPLQSAAAWTDFRNTVQQYLRATPPINLNTTRRIPARTRPADARNTSSGNSGADLFSNSLRMQGPPPDPVRGYHQC
ncbi:MAG: N-acetylmuramoyl-L-alanine amidase [Lewinellaceae bacterium]|nr:N-acetylmuramoyl-L-alanine amidase [Lewinellaceae bacterium]